MAVTATPAVEVQASAGVWTDITVDVLAGLRIRYGVQGSGPLDCVAGTGECSFDVRNDAGNSGGQVGYYSPIHASKRSGWTFGIPVQVVFAHGSDSAVAVSSITRSSTTATVTTGAAHGRATGDYVKIAGADQAEYNGSFQITVTGATTFTYTVSSAAVTPATGTITARRVRVKHRGKIAVIDPDAGQYGPRRVHVVSYDGMHDLVEADVRAVDIQIDQSESTLVSELLDSLASDAQPVSRDIDTGVDTFPYAFHDVGPGEKALTLVKRAAVNAFAFAAMKGDGTFILRSRQSRAAGTSAYTFNNTMHGLRAPSSLAQVYNVVRVTIHPKTVDAAATTVLYAATGTPLSIAAGQSLVVWADYRDPANTQTLIGGTAIVNPLVSGTDYAGNSQVDGLGSNLSASLSVTLEPFASTAKITITNNHATSTIYLVNGSGQPFLQVRGKGIYDRGPQTYEKASTASYGTRPFPIDLDYQSNASIAQSYADYVHAQFSDLSSRVESLTFVANESGDFMTQALDREPGDVITVTEPVTGLSAVEAVIHVVEIEYMKGGRTVVTWGLSPAAPFKAWVLGVAGRTELGLTTKLGF